MRRGKRLIGFGIFAIIALALTVFFVSDRTARETEAMNPGHGSCSTCHSLHSAPGQSISNTAVVEVLCLSCHGPAGTATLKAEVHSNKDGSSYPAFSMTCIDCHNPHDDIANDMGGVNLSQVGRKYDGNAYARIATPNSGDRYVVFESRGTDAGDPSLHSYADNDEDGNLYYDGVCETCHTQVANHRNDSSGNHAHFTGSNCITCHSHVDKFLGTGGGCTACHSTSQNGRRAVVGEFSLTSHHVAAGAVTDDDCAVCHYEAQGNHMDGNVDLLNPDTGSPITPFPAFSRNTASDSLESWVMDVQNNHCFKCHDSDGAVATNFSGNALQPFSSGGRDVPDVYDQFDTTNSYHHAIRGSASNPYCIPSGSNGNNITMEPPWNQDAGHDMISCFDCHSTSGHGSVNQRMLRSYIDLDTMETGTQSTTIGQQVEDFCTICHKAVVYVSGNDPEGLGSIFESHPSGIGNHSAAGGNELGCMGCHGGIVDLCAGMPPTGNGAARGNIHGGSFVWPAGTFSTGVTSQFFMVGGYLSGWMITGAIGECGGGACSHRGGVKKSGKTYTR